MTRVCSSWRANCTLRPHLAAHKSVAFCVRGGQRGWPAATLGNHTKIEPQAALSCAPHKRSSRDLLLRHVTRQLDSLLLEPKLELKLKLKLKPELKAPLPAQNELPMIITLRSSTKSPATRADWQICGPHCLSRRAPFSCFQVQRQIKALSCCFLASKLFA